MAETGEAARQIAEAADEREEVSDECGPMLE